jgi:hypothetical protein
MWLNHITLPEIGKNLVLWIPNSWLHIGNGRVEWRQVALLTGLSNPDIYINNWGLLMSSGEHIVVLPMLTGASSMKNVHFPIPNDTRLIGLTLYQQVFSVGSHPENNGLSKCGIAVVGN